jgi:GNAT superfamily N-acetyltransferase
MWVEPTHRNRGIGTSLVCSLLEKPTRGAQDITIRIVTGNAEAETFWKGLGFNPRIIVANAKPHKLLSALSKKPFNKG